MTRLAARCIGAAIFAALASCATAPATPGLDLSPTRTSPKGLFVVTLVPPASVPVQEIHEWRVLVATPDGAPVTNALVYVNGGMPEHGHGLPTRPVVSRELSPGTYLVEGMKFSMTGWWEIYVAVQKGPASDVTTFNRIVAAPPRDR